MWKRLKSFFRQREVFIQEIKPGCKYFMAVQRGTMSVFEEQKIRRRFLEFGAEIEFAFTAMPPRDSVLIMKESRT